MKADGKVFSFRSEEEKVRAWRVYAQIKGIKVDDMGTKAMQDYIKKHPLKGPELELFNQRMGK